MRIISQNGAIDVPYEMSAIRNDDKLIILCMAGETGKGSVIARYSTSEKAEKAMEMLREEYKDYAKATNKSNFFTMFDYPKVFQFPKNEDVEV